MTLYDNNVNSVAQSTTTHRVTGQGNRNMMNVHSLPSEEEDHADKQISPPAVKWIIRLTCTKSPFSRTTMSGMRKVTANKQ